MQSEIEANITQGQKFLNLIKRETTLQVDTQPGSYECEFGATAPGGSTPTPIAYTFHDLVLLTDKAAIC